MDNLSAYKIWAPDGALWAQWAKPVLFMSTRGGHIDLATPELPWAEAPDGRTALIVDLPGVEGVEEGLALAGLGYRPVPLYNGVDGPGVGLSLIDTQGLVFALRVGAGALQNISLPAGAPPAFLLDASRMNSRAKRPGWYDNRWCVFPQDMPSASLLRAHGITRIVLRTRVMRVPDDLAHVLCRYQEKDIRIEICCKSKNDQYKAITVSKPSRFKGLLYRFQAISGLTRNAAGGFGGLVPEPTQHGTVGYRGIG